MKKPPLSSREKLTRMNRPFAVFLVFFAAFVIFGSHYLSQENFKLIFGLLALLFMVFWIYGAVHMPGAISEHLSKSHHPDEDVRALQDGEISIREYADRKAAKELARAAKISDSSSD